MIDWTWITTTDTTLFTMLLSGVVVYAALLLFTRLVGLRSFSKMSTFDFAITVAFGTIVASTMLVSTPSLFVGVGGLAVLFGIQFLVSWTRRHSKFVERCVDNEPLLVMAGEEVLSDHLDKARMTEDDLRSKLRTAGITHPSQVLAVIMETTGDVSVLRTSDQVDPWLFEEVRGAEYLSALPGHAEKGE